MGGFSGRREIRWKGSVKCEKHGPYFSLPLNDGKHLYRPQFNI